MHTKEPQVTWGVGGTKKAHNTGTQPQHTPSILFSSQSVILKKQHKFDSQMTLSHISYSAPEFLKAR